MEDNKILELYWERSQDAIVETQHKYGRYCHYIASNILQNAEDVDEIINDTWLRAWHSIPPQRPRYLQAFLGKITRNLALNYLEKAKAQKRGAGERDLVLEEIDTLVPGTVDGTLDRLHFKQVLDVFLSGLKPEQRRIFVRRYWYMDSVNQIADSLGITESKVTVTLCRLRQKLAQKLQEEEIWK